MITLRDHSTMETPNADAGSSNQRLYHSGFGNLLQVKTRRAGPLEGEFCAADLKAFADQAFQRDVAHNDITPVCSIVETDPSFELDVVEIFLRDHRNFAFVFLTPEPTALAIAVTAQASPGDGLDLIHLPHWCACLRRNEQLCN